MPALSSRQQPAIRGAWVLSPRQPPVLAGALGRAVGLEPGSPSRLLRWPSGATAPSCARRSPCSLRSPASTRRRARTRRGAAIGWCRAAARCPTGCWAIARRGGVARMHRPVRDPRLQVVTAWAEQLAAQKTRRTRADRLGGWCVHATAARAAHSSRQADGRGL